ncbi:hypothetical protein [Glycomyces tenuis]|uniref:hypothetical protein n=1 Tax=Glycomyces tenuis TaxID=58116 RepID=UPI00047BCD61|nr:hypothetical protein [Glycomyces tenuis]
MVFDNGVDGREDVKHFRTTNENVAAIMADMKSGRMTVIEMHERFDDRIVKVSTTIVRIERIKLIEIKDA